MVAASATAALTRRPNPTLGHDVMEEETTVVAFRVGRRWVQEVTER